MRNGLLASRARLTSLTLQFVGMGNEALNELRLIYKNQNGSSERQNNTTVLRELDLSHNDFKGRDGGKHLHGLLLTLPCLDKLVVTFNNDFGPNGARSK
jgi:hypothetical protein